MDARSRDSPSCCCADFVYVDFNDTMGLSLVGDPTTSSCGVLVGTPENAAVSSAHCKRAAFVDAGAAPQYAYTAGLDRPLHGANDASDAGTAVEHMVVGCRCGRHV